jgi:hypothetical protein
MATEICNAVNQLKFPNEFETEYKICRNTFMSTLAAYMDFDSKVVLRQKMGKKDKDSEWAIAHKTIAQQMLEQIETGKKIDSGELTLHDAHTNDALPPIFPDAVLHLYENHTVASLGGVGQDGSFSRQQYFVSVDKNTGELKG